MSGTQAGTTAPSGSGLLTIAWKAVALTCLIVALACLVTLVVVVTVKDVDLLSTVAMALAILAFVVQLIVYIVQSSEMQRQTAHSEQLHGQLLALVSQLQERAQGTQQSVDRMNSRMLEALIGKAEAESETSGGGREAFATRLADTLANQRGNSDGGSATTDGVNSYPNPYTKQQAAAIHEEMLRWPTSAELEPLLGVIEGLDAFSLGTIALLARDVVSTLRYPTRVGPGLVSGATKSLDATGLTEPTATDGPVTLSPQGRIIGRLITAKGEFPSELSDYAELRQRLLDSEL